MLQSTVIELTLFSASNYKLLLFSLLYVSLPVWGIERVCAPFNRNPKTYLACRCLMSTLHELHISNLFYFAQRVWELVFEHDDMY